MKTYNYVNDLGYTKQIKISKDENRNNYICVICAQGEPCGYKDMTKEELFDFLSYYNITFNKDDFFYYL